MTKKVAEPGFVDAILREMGSHFEMHGNTVRAFPLQLVEYNAFRAEIERLREIEWMYNGLCK